MGLLDDAIREHLELKRLRGADPGEVAHEAHEALGPVIRGSSTKEDDGHDAPSSTSGAFFSDVEPAPANKPSDAGQETVEINMDAELNKGAAATGQDDGRNDERHSAQQRTVSDDSLEWEMPGDRSVDSGSPTETDPEGDGPVEDVLEETPDFLRDTPEQERLWFEQRPPRDFDFNE